MPDDLRLHGRTDPLGQYPVALEWSGRLQPVTWHRKRWDLDRQTLTHSRLEVWHDFWEVELRDGTRLVVFRDLQHSGGWYEDVNATRGVEADAACAEIERQAQASVAWRGCGNRARGKRRGRCGEVT